MKILEATYDEKLFNYAPFDIYFGNKRGAVFDIETTGLSPKKASLILSGFVIPKSDGRLCLKQFFAESLDDEANVISETLKLLYELDYVVTYNGLSFDMPFVINRAKKYMADGLLPCDSRENTSKNIDIDERLPYNLDLFRLLKRYSELRSFVPNLKQKTIENYLGLWDKRFDTIDGKESIDLYASYLASKNPLLLEKILLHNSDDVKQLYRLLAVLKKLDLHKAVCFEGFPLDIYADVAKNIKAEISQIKLKKDQLCISGFIKNTSLNCKSFDDEKGLFINFNNKHFTVNKKLINAENIVFANLTSINLSQNLFKNCGGLMDDFLVIFDGKEINYNATALLGKYLIERIIKNELLSGSECR